MPPPRAGTARRRRNRGGRVGIGLSLLLLAPACAALAQAPAPAAESPGAPISLFPPPSAPATPNPPAASPLPAGEPPPIAKPSPAGEPSSVPIEVQPLGAPAAAWVGLLTPDNGGLPADLWSGTPAERVAKLLAQLPPDTGSPAAQRLAVRLLTTEAKAPSGAGPSAPLLGPRLQWLLASGQTEAAARLLDRAGSAGRAPDAAAVRADLALLGHDEAGACALADAMRKQNGAAYWLRLSAFCAARVGDSAAMQLDLDLLSDTNAVDDGFAALLSRVPAANAAKRNQPEKDRKPAKLPAAGPVTAPTYAVYRAAGIALPIDDTARLSLPVLRAVATDPAIEPARRIPAANAAAAAGAVPAAALADLYRTATFDPDQLAHPGEAKLPGPLGAALLFQASDKAADATVKWLLVGAALARARADGTFPLASALYAPALSALPAQADDPGFAALATEALLASDRADTAFPWFLAVQSAAKAGNADAAAALHRIWPILAISVPSSRFPVEPKDVADWADKGSGDTALPDLRMLALLDAVGRPVPGPAWWAVLDRKAETAAPRTPFALRRLAADSGRRKRLGETILESLVVIGPDGARLAPPDDLATALTALRAAGLDADARAIARDAALAGGR